MSNPVTNYATQYVATSYQAQTSLATSSGADSFSLALSAQLSTSTVSTSSYSAALSGLAGSSASSADSLELTYEAYTQIRTRYAQSVYELLFPSKAASGSSGQYKTLDEVGQDFQNDFNTLTGTLSGLFQSAGLTLNPPISMQLDGMGGITTTTEGDNGEAATVGSLFKNSGALVSQFAVMAARGAISRAGTSVAGFAEAYGEDPAGAIRQYIGDLEGLLFDFTLTAGSDGMGYHF